jgi:hypothetical protein
VAGNLDNTGKFAFTVGPGFSQKGNLTLTVTVGTKKKTLAVQFV